MASSNVVRFTHERTTEDKRKLQREILEMRTAGMSFDAIGRALGKSHTYCYKLYEHALNAIISPQVEALRKQEGERLDTMLIPCMAQIMQARDAAIAGIKYELPENAIKLAVSISDRRSKLFGLDAPNKISLNHQAKDPSDMLAGLMNLGKMESSELATLHSLLTKAMDALPKDEELVDDGAE